MVEIRECERGGPGGPGGGAGCKPAAPEPGCVVPFANEKCPSGCRVCACEDSRRGRMKVWECGGGEMKRKEAEVSRWRGAETSADVQTPTGGATAHCCT